MKIPSIKDLVTPLLLLAFTGTVVRYFNSVFTSSSRWVFLLVILLYILFSKRRIIAPLFRTGFMKLVFVAIAWNLATTMWSYVPELSLMKSIACGLVMIGGVSAGYFWVRQNPKEKAFDYILPLYFMVLVAAFFGRNMIQSTEDSGLTLFQGLTGNPNTFGVLLAMAFPYSAWKYSQKHSYIWLGSTLLLVVMVLLTNSRASMATVFISGMIFFYLQEGKKVFPLLFIIVIILPLLYFALPSKMTEALQDRYVYKESERELFSSRESTWEISYANAMQGGLIGGGYGVTIGDKSFNIGLTSFGYGREKGSSQLGIIEETGIIGFIIYLLLTAHLLYCGIGAWKKCRNQRYCSQIGLAFGMLAGFVVQSLFEGWYGAPGAPEFIYYWMMAGAGIAIIHKEDMEKNEKNRTEN
jgi:hypothetical protein